jgi:hypothetical protein
MIKDNPYPTAANIGIDSFSSVHPYVSTGFLKIEYTQNTPRPKRMCETTLVSFQRGVYAAIVTTIGA